MNKWEIIPLSLMIVFTLAALILAIKAFIITFF